ncbi:MAG: hypothetical protein FJ098_10355, partial [Deltaproteobacteria bacterium]|nr:hypothetical protein [Deltaproteobacteria bacterium]
ADAGVCPCTAKAVALGLTTPCVLENRFGACAGVRACTKDGLGPCDAAEPLAEICNGQDDDCDGEADEPHLDGGVYVALCDDGNPCTGDSCDGAVGCTHVALTDVECMDGNVCTVGDHCEDGVCQGTLVTCDDQNPCTDDLCDGAGGCSFLPNDGDCDDEDPCTVGDQCKGSICAGFPVACDCQADADCAGLEDGNACNGTLFCDTGELPFRCAVEPGTVPLCPGPPPGPDLLCLAAACDPVDGACGLVPASQDLPCDDLDACTAGERCDGGACGEGVPVNCNDGNPCTDDGCQAGTGCSHTLNNLPCNDGNACTTGDHCSLGACAGGSLLPCNDGDPCTTNGCDPQAGCQFSPWTGGSCSDGNACTTGDHCVVGTCIHTKLVDCDDGNPCTTEICDPAEGCLHLLNQGPCDDGDVCTHGDSCHLGECQGASTFSCDDGNPCTDDGCHPLLGCQFAPNSAPCDDGNPCTAEDACAEGWCKGFAPADCDDGNGCTTDACQFPAGCLHADLPDGTPCLDEGVAKVCIGGSCTCAPDCTGRECGDDGCGGSCGSCGDSDACTLNEQCTAGLCTFTPLTCGDGNLCTDDTCDPATGCVFTPNGAPCSDGNACTTGDHCAGGVCTGTPLPSLPPWSFTPAGATGRLGPTQAQVSAAYAGTVLAGTVTVTGGIQAWTVPYTGTYTISAAGAKGGDGGGNEPGKGAVVTGDFSLGAGTTLYVLVGQMGLLSKQDCCWTYGASGGGGASWVYTDPNGPLPLLVAAGGGGHAENATAGHGSGTSTPTQGSGGSGTSGAGGIVGQGGAHGPSNLSYTPGAGGAGWLSNGQNAPTIRNPGGLGGQAPGNGGQGGYGVHDSYGPEHASGGFGGGGAGSDNTGAGGGGGGFNGGGGGRNYAGSGNWGAGGGGGSYNGGTNPSSQTGQNDGHGWVTITFECN